MTNRRNAMLLAGLVLAGCAPPADMPMYQQSRDAQATKIQDSLRVTVTRIGVFRDDLAYNDRRGVYLIEDKQTGKTFIGVSGVGISETGSHSQSCGKTTCVVGDER